MIEGISKQDLKAKWVKPKDMVKKFRMYEGLTTQVLADSIGVDRRQYELKEKGVYPFKDYEMLIIANLLKQPIDKLFFDGN